MNLEIITLTADKLRVDYVGFVYVLVVIVILEHCQQFVDGRRRNERGSDPVVDQAMRHLDRSSPGPELRYHLSSTDLLRTFWRQLRPEEWLVPVQRRLHLRFNVVDVSIKCCKGSRVQLYRLCS